MSDIDLSLLLNWVLGVDGYEVGDLESRSKITQIESNL
jgi:hypothetical protein